MTQFLGETRRDPGTPGEQDQNCGIEKLGPSKGQNRESKIKDLDQGCKTLGFRIKKNDFFIDASRAMTTYIRQGDGLSPALWQVHGHLTSWQPLRNLQD